jgi:peptidoglycan/xylan/chitin deacetylase (PgdA/CDA1 family)
MLRVENHSPARNAVLTFDDGHKSDHAFVAPILQEFGFGATFFITEGLGFLKS